MKRWKRKPQHGALPDVVALIEISIGSHSRTQFRNGWLVLYGCKSSRLESRVSSLALDQSLEEHGGIHASRQVRDKRGGAAQ